MSNSHERKKQQMDEMARRLETLKIKRSAERKAKPVFTYLEYLEFAGEEFKKFRNMPAVSDADLRDLDMDALLKKFAEHCNAPKLRDT